MSETSESFNGESQSFMTSDEDTEQETPLESVVDIDINIEDEEHIDKSETGEPLSSKPGLIFRVLAHVREVDERAYKPKIVSIGPFHHNEPGLKAFEDYKKRFLDRLLKQISKPSLENAMKKLEEKTRKCYSESFDDMNSNDFVQMMVLDGCFIVGLLRLYDKGEDVSEPIFATRSMLPVIGRDLLMLENQLPMFVLEELFKLTDFNREASSLNKLALKFFEPLRPGKDKLPNEMLNVNIDHQHLMALFQSSFGPGDYRAPSPNPPERWNKYGILPPKGWVRNATTLRYAGVRFRNKSGGLLDIEFGDTFLRIPTLFIENGSSSVLSNLVAYEQSNRYAAPYFTSLAVFFNSLVDSPKDISVLRDAGIIRQTHGGDEEVVNLLKTLTKELEYDMDDCYITKQIEDINHFCRSWMAKIKIGFLRALLQTDFTKFGFTYLSSVATTILFSPVYTNSSPESTPSISPSPSPS